ENIKTLQHLEQRRPVAVDPVIHGVAGDQLYIGHGLAHTALQDWIDVGEEKKLRVAIGRGNLGFEGSKDVQLGIVRHGFVEVFEVGAFPAKAFPGSALDAAGVDVTRAKNRFLFGTKIFAHHSDDANIGEKTRGKRKVSGGTAQAAVAAAGGGFNGIVGYAAHYGDGHGFRFFSVLR